jgi:hypothetical protein
MRFIIPELAYEQPLARGVWRYERGGVPTGAIEHWRLNAARDGYHFLRVDLDARAARSGRSYIYHFVLDSDDKPLRLKYRLWQGNREVAGDVQLDADSILHTSGQGDGREEMEIHLPPGYQFWFPSSTALGWLARGRLDNEQAAFALVVDETVEAQLHVAPLVTTLYAQYEQFDTNRAVTMSFEDQQRTVRMNASGWPVRMARQDDLVAIETQLVKYKRITAPGVG